MDWVDILVPGAAILALFGVVGLVIQSIRLGRAIRRVEEQAAAGGGSATEVPLRRLQELQARIEGRPLPGPSGEAGEGRDARRRLAVAAASILVVALAGAGVWYLFVRDDGAGTAEAGSRTTATTTTTARPQRTAVPSDRVPATVPPLDNKAAYTVAVFNASGVTGAAANKVAPRVVAAGYAIGPVDNAQAQDPSKSVVMWAKGKKIAAWNVAKDLGVSKATPLDGGFSAQGLGSVDVVVIVGLDLAQG
ncbi:MAG: LytR C-terminal domain-containing protein [Actinomycetota bacterium]